jgi:hypothetical protein
VVLTLVVAPSLFLLGVAWSFASPPGSSADEGFHLSSIWCAWGDHEDCVRDPADGSVQVPQQVAEADCFALQEELNARCTWLLTDELVRTETVNPPSGVYPPVFYATMRAFVGPDVARSVLVMRMANVALAAVLLALALWVSPMVVRRALAVVWAVAMIPVGIFFIASVNPSSWAITGVGLFWAFGWTLARSRTLRSPSAIVAGVGAIATAVMAIGARSDMVLPIGLSIVAVGVMEWRSIRSRVPTRWLVGGGVVVGALLVAVAWVFHVGGYLSKFSPSFPPGNASTDQPNPLLKTLLEVPAFVAGVFGGQQPWTQRESINDWGQEGYSWHGFTYGVGAVDVVNPSIAAVLVGACAAAVLFLGLGRASRRKLVVVAALCAAFLGQIVLMRALVGFGAWWSGGVQWSLQPRYFLPLAMVILAFTVTVFPRSVPFLTRTQAGVIAIFLSIAAVTSLAGTMGRFVHGQDHSWVQLDPATGWWWSWGLSPTGFVVLGAVAGTIYMVAAMIIAREPGSQATLRSPRQARLSGHADGGDSDGQ